MRKLLVAFPCQLVQGVVTETRPGGGGTSGGSLRSSRQAAACHPFTRSWATMPPEPPPPPGLLRYMAIPDCSFQIVISRGLSLAERQSGCGHGLICNLLIISYHNGGGVETWPKKGCVSTPCFITHCKSAPPKMERGRVPTGGLGHPGCQVS